ncbi:LacI family DNA-binding transcriptional regulator [Curtobacterium pusillum]|uniref:LacI family DNA-binding transcriptional regulator n=1 Tax=Curtobacterium pusillum TaxID=69373 RepID=UPI00119F1FB6|nr:LacI family DNA-binding transcriptional regulator [Curtobacterium pusillum]
MLTMKDVATRAGVSVSTVSLVLSGRHQGRVRDSVVEHVRDVADTLGYVPDLMARGLRTRQTHTIGLISDRVASIPFAGQMIGGAQRVAIDEKYLILLVDTDGEQSVVRDALTMLLQRNVDALIYACEYHQVVVPPVVPARVPLVILDGRPEDPTAPVDWIIPDERGGAAGAVAELTGAGHRRIGFCTVSRDMPARDLRFLGYTDALAAAGIPFDPALVVEAAEAGTVHTLEPARALLDRPDRPTAVFCFGDRMANAVYHVAHELGLRIPQDLSVVGFDNQLDISEGLVPGLTTVQLPHRAMGELAARLTIERSLEPPHTEHHPTEHVVPCPVVRRGSVAPPERTLPPPVRLPAPELVP